MPRVTGRRERGATSVMVALCLIVLLGFAAISIDVAAFFNERQRLQVGADAAVLAIAADCAKGSCGGASATARRYVSANTATPTATAALNGTPTPSSGRVTVVASATTEHWFAPVLGFDSSDPTATATARWGSPVAGRAMLPLIFGWCEWNAQTGGGRPSTTTPRVIKFTKTSGTGCTGKSGNTLPGGFGWLTPTGPGCDVASRVGTWVASDPGNDQSCDESTIATFRNAVILLPIFDEAKGNGRNGEYRVMGYAAFKLTGYYFTGKSRWNDPCDKNERCIAGYFVSYVADSTWEYGTGAPSFGASVVRLTA